MPLINFFSDLQLNPDPQLMYRPGLLNGTGQTLEMMNYRPGLPNAARQALEKEALYKGLLTGGLSMLAMSGPSKMPVSLGQITGQGLLAALQQAENYKSQMLQNLLEQEKLRREEEKFREEMGIKRKGLELEKEKLEIERGKAEKPEVLSNFGKFVWDVFGKLPSGLSLKELSLAFQLYNSTDKGRNLESIKEEIARKYAAGEELTPRELDLFNIFFGKDSENIRDRLLEKLASGKPLTQGEQRVLEMIFVLPALKGSWDYLYLLPPEERQKYIDQQLDMVERFFLRKDKGKKNEFVWDENGLRLKK